jgi:hypothetical protein
LRRGRKSLPQVTLNEPKDSALVTAPAASGRAHQHERCETKRTAGRAQHHAQPMLPAAAVEAEAEEDAAAATVPVPTGMDGAAKATAATVVAVEERRKTVRGNLIYGGARRPDTKTVAVAADDARIEEARGQPHGTPLSC